MRIEIENKLYELFKEQKIKINFLGKRKCEAGFSCSNEPGDYIYDFIIQMEGYRSFPVSFKNVNQVKEKMKVCMNRNKEDLELKKK